MNQENLPFGCLSPWALQVRAAFSPLVVKAHIEDFDFSFRRAVRLRYQTSCNAGSANLIPRVCSACPHGMKFRAIRTLAG